MPINMICENQINVIMLYTFWLKYLQDSFDSDDGHLYIVMGFCDGGDLYNKLKEQKGSPLDEKQVVEWFVQIAMALQVRGIVSKNML